MIDIRDGQAKKERERDRQKNTAKKIQNSELNLPPLLFCGNGCVDGAIRSSSQYASAIKMFKLIKIQ